MLPFALAYFLSHIYRSANAVIAPDLVESLGLSAADLGLLSSTFMLAFAIAQLPLGVLLDLLGPRRVNAALLLIAASGGLLFALSSHVTTMAIARAMMGIGVAASLMAALKAMANEFPPHWMMPMHSIMVATGGVGAIVATAPLETIVRLFGWQAVFLLLAVATLIASMVLLVSAPEVKNPRRNTSWCQELAGLKSALSHWFFIGVGPAVGLLQGGFMAIQTLWAGPWLYMVVGLNRMQVGYSLLLMAAGMVAGYLINGFLGAKAPKWGINPIAVALTGAGLLLVTFATIILMGAQAPLTLWVIYGFFGTSAPMSFALIGQEVPIKYVGRVSTSMNFLVFSIGFLFQWGIGEIIRFCTKSSYSLSTEHAYQMAFSITWFLQLGGWVWLARTTLLMRRLTLTKST
ncbi:MFS transporter [Vreelandella olivaria]|uniref:MFS transporter n=1 Tax=Vreelandella olivaria TaxID=390919 RepID=UPI00201F3299|nr:MFS transporter [Halomonas olivaria]